MRVRFSHPLPLACVSQAVIQQLLAQEEDQTKLQLLIIGVKDEMRHGESEERACMRVLERMEAPDSKPAAAHGVPTTAATVERAVAPPHIRPLPPQ